MRQLPSWLKEVEIEMNAQQKESIEQYLRDKYGDHVPVVTGGKLGKYLSHYKTKCIEGTTSKCRFNSIC